MYHEKSSYYEDLLSKLRSELPNDIIGAINYLGKKRISLRFYHDEDIVDRYTFFEVDDDGYGRELFIDTVTIDENKKVHILLHDSEDTYNPIWELEDLTTTDALYFLTELEALCAYKDENPDEEIVSDYEGDD